ncbi:4-(cytidine 5'-diphospho)-2-C-methyl-D-erythritol kinase [Carboxylicivirga sp. M1479]|uniref:4-(cytidine 5'-diphospho)-2-C-methyl-D-erythritol kinase n=1 Tax=Carboxylicivirga sp. M1479 TaxID=2594476 RepID=UPI001178BE7D|nr:4-(cytidine 5'-diphospho)-2-C-methyl-D-erythritol kinase [Carboxylicivirga sp. M1479]TRX71553.1 4-(cytidine 5'-diphospho)-2-C-methyl-D-erythritol kinase [Carboxylicivirga sp. M1479]
MICYPNAKINIGLNVVEKRSDGYHNLETIFYPIPLCDALEAVHTSEDKEPYTFSSSGIKIDGKDEDNICIKALHLIKEHCQLPALKIHLHKLIPFGAGLGGGSADGAFMLNLLNKEFELKLSDEILQAMAAQLGADCAVFIKNKPAYATGIGDVLQTIDLNLSGYYMALIKPPIHVSTPDAYQGVIPTPSSHPLTELIKLPINQWKHHIKNDFEASVFKKYPEIGNIKMQLYNSGAQYACMSGSGSSVFGIFKEEPQLKVKPDYFTWIKKL